MRGFERGGSAVRGKEDEGGTSPSDPTLKKGPGSPKGENMPPAGGESMAPADTKHAPAPPGGVKREPEAEA